MATRISDAELDAYLLNASAGDVRQSSTVGTLSAASGNDTSASTAPPNAKAAPTGSSTEKILGLCEALNQYEQEKVKEGVYKVANIYEIIFNPKDLAQSTLAKPGLTNKAMTASQTGTTAKEKVDPATNSVNTTSRTISVLSGTQIVQFIEQTMRGSSYITDQQKYIYDEVTGKEKLNENAPRDGQTTWFKINVQATPLAYDENRKDHAYKMTYVITPFGVNQLQSQYFSDSRFRGVHKVYNYWFTGENTSVLSFEQKFNALFFTVMSGENAVQNSPKDQGIVQVKRVAQTASGQGDKGAKNKTNEPAANAADYLYSQADQASISLKIVGDPAWIQQGEVIGVNPTTFSFKGFLPDGTINSDASQVVFVVNWNAPADYNMETGLMEVDAKNRSPNGAMGDTLPQSSSAYTAVSVISTFNRGKFEQELKGVILTNLNNVDLPKDSGRDTDPVNNSAAGSRNRTTGQIQQEIYPGALPSTSESTGEDQNKITVPARSPQIPTSNGGIRVPTTPIVLPIPGVNDPTRTNQQIVTEE